MSVGSRVGSGLGVGLGAGEGAVDGVDSVFVDAVPVSPRPAGAMRPISTSRRLFDVCHHIRSRPAGPKRDEHFLARSQYANVLHRWGFDGKCFFLTQPATAQGNRSCLHIERDHARVCVPARARRRLTLGCIGGLRFRRSRLGQDKQNARNHGQTRHPHFSPHNGSFVPRAAAV
jgi:hypothetical protein